MVELDVKEVPNSYHVTFEGENGIKKMSNGEGKGVNRAINGDEVRMSCNGVMFKVKDIVQGLGGGWIGRVVNSLVYKGSEIYFRADQQIAFDEKNILGVIRR